MAKKKQQRADEPLKFDQALEQLQQIVTQLEEGQLSLEDTLQGYEQGIRHLRHCYDLLAAAERRVELLGGVDEQGRTQTTPFTDDGAPGPSPGPRRRSAQRGAATKKPNGPDAPDVDADTRLF